ncbi:MAG TPA: hypothetical protein D7I10_02940 [Candidatus Poseidoniales archaeon]|nr:MAG TPA: hypothetical protein D7I10_02940 [Candidatus Poseidoniales archaeon]HIH81376.1 hypothetical protein [Candidatus Thalassarchaeaceae archaeon]|tara:strand:- start:531 stop:1187 length:657 start_codon:yes stop_codon:yes gene_type:complete
MQQKSILIIGAGGIGGLLLDLLSRSISFSGSFEVKISIMDGDVVEQRNLPHQRFSISDLGNHKVHALNDYLQHLVYTADNGVMIDPICTNFSGKIELEEFDLIIVAVDCEEPRRIVHANANQWLDLRARGDGFVIWSHLDNLEILDSLPKLPEGISASCQLDGAIETGNIQFGFALAAAHGAQWVIQWLRGGNPPSGKMYSIHMGELPMPEPSQGSVE